MLSYIGFVFYENIYSLKESRLWGKQKEKSMRRGRRKKWDDSLRLGGRWRTVLATKTKLMAMPWQDHRGRALQML